MVNGGNGGRMKVVEEEEAANVVVSWRRWFYGFYEAMLRKEISAPLTAFMSALKMTFPLYHT
jgi:hypothetical protein